jgi:hypothetical protein
MRLVPQRISALGPLLAGAALAGCMNEPLPQNGICETTSAFSCDTILAGNPNAGVSAGLVAYSCSGTARPDDHPQYIGDYPMGVVCATEGVPDTNGNQAYCCTSGTTSCAYNPVGICPAGNTGFQCRGSERPEVLNAGMTCGNGVHEDPFIDYCCVTATRAMVPGCTQNKGVCPASLGLNGWSCPTGTLPKGEDFGMSQSRADDYYFVCAVAQPAPNPAISNYCCFTPTPLQPGGSCVTDPTITSQVPSCTAPRFGFSCQGRERPEDDYLPIVCNDPPVDGTDAQGYMAKLYCCDYMLPM